MKIIPQKMDFLTKIFKNLKFRVIIIYTKKVLKRNGMNQVYEELMNEAKKISQNAYAPYSNFPVGACVLCESGKKYSGCNVENASYGLAVCAERNAMSTAVIQGEKTKIEAIAIYSPKQHLCMPCGACRQWLKEFSKDGNTKVILEDKNGALRILTLDDIFPYGFTFE